MAIRQTFPAFPGFNSWLEGKGGTDLWYQHLFTVQSSGIQLCPCPAICLSMHDISLFCSLHCDSLSCMLDLSQTVRATLCYRIPAAYLQGTKPFIHPDQAEAPLIVFINSRSGGRAGASLTETLYQTLGHSQVGPTAQPFLC